MNRFHWPLYAIIFGIMLLLILLVVPSYVVEWLWMDSLSYEFVFWDILIVKGLLFGAALVVMGGYIIGNGYAWLNLIESAANRNDIQRRNTLLGIPGLRKIVLSVFALFSIFIAAGYASNWDAYLRFAHSQPFGEADPIYGIDLSFYMLRLPFLELIQNSLTALTFLGVLISAGISMWSGDLRIDNRKLQMNRKSARTLVINLSLFLAMLAWGYYLDRYELLFGSRGLITGANFADVQVRIPMLWVMLFTTIGLGGFAVFAVLSDRLQLLFSGAAGFFAILIIGLWIVPSIVQQFVVNPNELAKEEPYISHNIDLTRRAYQLNDVEEKSYTAKQNLTLNTLDENEQTIRNIRLWDPRLLIQTYRQIQEIRLYYQFYDVDVDRYLLDGAYRQVMLSGRELAQDLPDRADTWVNRHLQFTHGYGLAMNLVAREGEEGTPELLVKDLPPVSAEGLEVRNPAIYYGEHSPTYHIVNSGARELDYPSGDENVYTQYDGPGGVAMSGFGRRLLFAWFLSDLNILLSEYITPESRIQFWKRVRERISRIAPFLKLDSETYLVVSQGKLYWVQDAYTYSHTFPYSEPSPEGFNYMRNSVKIIVDAYSGAVTFYRIGEGDPVLETYDEAFPGLFQPIDALPEELKRHLRYPMDFFNVQVDIFNRYHMVDPQVFYNNEDLWTQPREQYGGSSIPMEPYYILMRLAGESDLQFLLMTPLTPDNRDNMIAWIAARSDFPGYGELIVYKLPKEKLIYGPNQIESKIDQDTEISQQLSLWDQRGSRVIRGNLIAVPIGEAFIYVEPVFLVAEETEIPQLRRVIVTYGEQVVMEPTLDQALQVLFKGRRSEAATPDGAPSLELVQAREAMRQLQEALQDTDYGAFGEALQSLQDILSEANDETDNTSEP